MEWSWERKYKMLHFFCLFFFQDPREKLILSLKKEIKVLRNENHYLRQQVSQHHEGFNFCLAYDKQKRDICVAFPVSSLLVGAA